MPGGGGGGGAPFAPGAGGGGAPDVSVGVVSVSIASSGFLSPGRYKSSKAMSNIASLSRLPANSYWIFLVVLFSCPLPSSLQVLLQSSCCPCPLRPSLLRPMMNVSVSAQAQINWITVAAALGLRSLCASFAMIISFSFSCWFFALNLFLASAMFCCSNTALSADMPDPSKTNASNSTMTVRSMQDDL